MTAEEDMKLLRICVIGYISLSPLTTPSCEMKIDRYTIPCRLLSAPSITSGSGLYIMQRQTSLRPRNYYCTQRRSLLLTIDSINCSCLFHFRINLTVLQSPMDVTYPPPPLRSEIPHVYTRPRPTDNVIPNIKHHLT